MKALKLFSILAIALLFGACSDSAKQLAEKIDSKATLSESDYTTAIDYCGKFAKEAETLQDQIDGLPDDSKKAATDETKLAALKDKFPYLEKFAGVIKGATPEQVGPANVQKINEYAQYIWFDAPDWASIQTDPNVAGFIEQTPAEGSAAADSGVVAGGAGEIATETVKE